MDMGLVLARQVAEAHGGSANAAVEPGRGMSLRLRLPLAEA
jgi:signal transduction histidine kinase